MESTREALIYVQDFFAQYAAEELSDADKNVQWEELKEDLQDWLLNELTVQGESLLCTDEQQSCVDRYYDLSLEEVDILLQWLWWVEKYQSNLNERVKDVITQSIDRDFTLPDIST